MPKRTIKTAIATYRSADGAYGTVGNRGDEVDVHADDVARFDELNAEPAEDEVRKARLSLGHNLPDYSAPGPEYTSPSAENSGTGSGLNTTVTDDEVSESTAEQDAKADPDTAPKSRKK